ncbi:unnamed protein product [Gadus morhua 'NCC']
MKRQQHVKTHCWLRLLLTSPQGSSTRRECKPGPESLEQSLRPRPARGEEEEEEKDEEEEEEEESDGKEDENGLEEKEEESNGEEYDSDYERRRRRRVMESWKKREIERSVLRRRRSRRKKRRRVVMEIKSSDGEGVTQLTGSTLHPPPRIGPTPGQMDRPGSYPRFTLGVRCYSCWNTVAPNLFKAGNPCDPSVYLVPTNCVSPSNISRNYFQLKQPLRERRPRVTLLRHSSSIIMKNKSEGAIASGAHLASWEDEGLRGADTFDVGRLS